MLDGIISITMGRYLLELEALPETRKNISLKECLEYLLNNRPDTEESLNDRNTVEG